MDVLCECFGVKPHVDRRQCGVARTLCEGRLCDRPLEVDYAVYCMFVVYYSCPIGSVVCDNNERVCD